MKSTKLRPEIIVLPFAAAILTYILMVPPIIGVADNGDFQRIMSSTGLEYLSKNREDCYFGFINSRYRSIDSLPFKGGYFSTQLILVIFSKLFSGIILWKRQLFDIRSLSILYCIVFLISIYLIVRFNKQGKAITDTILILLLILVFTDVGYISYFNSLYGEAVSFSFMLLTTGLSICLVRQDSQKLPLLVLFFISSIIFVGAKAQNAPVGIVLAIFCWRLSKLDKSKVWKRTILSFSIFLAVLSVAAYSAVSSHFKQCNKYQTVFFGILKDSQTPEEDLEALGLNPEYAVLADTNYFMGKYPLDIHSPYFQKEINENVNPFKITMFYLQHPSRLVQKLEDTANYGFKIVEGYGNYEKSSGAEYGQAVRFPAIWSSFKMEFLPHSLKFVVFFFSAYFAVLGIHYRKAANIKSKLYCEALTLVGITGVIQFLVPVIGDGNADLSKHLFLFNVCFDAMFITSTIWIVHLFLQAPWILNKKLLNRRA